MAEKTQKVSDIESEINRITKPSSSKIKDLIEKIKCLSEEELSTFDQNLIKKLYSESNPYGRTLDTEDGSKYCSLSFINMQKKYMEKLTITSMIAYLNRACDEWGVPDGLPIFTVYDCIDNPSKLDTPKATLEAGNEDTLADYEYNRRMFEKRKIVKEFLEYTFQFNPNEHVQSAYKPNYKDKDREIIQTMAGRLAQEHYSGMFKKKPTSEQFEFRLKKETSDDINNIPFKKVKKTIKNTKTGETKTIISRKVSIPMIDSSCSTSKVVDKDPDAYKNATNFIPPMDLFAGYNNYFENNYESLIRATTALYSEKPLYDAAIIPYSIHNDEKEAAEFRKRNADNVLADIHTVKMCSWNILAPYKENMKDIEVINQNTEVLEAMLLQHKADMQMGDMLVKSKIKKKKKEQKILVGKNDDSFQKWKKSYTTHENVVDSDDDCPIDAVELPIWKTCASTGQVVKEKMFLKKEKSTKSQGVEFNPNSNLTSEDLINSINDAI